MTSQDLPSTQSGHDDESGVGGPGAPTPLSALEGVAGLTKRDIQLIVDGGFNTVESVAYTPRRVLEQIKGISEQKATKILSEGMSVLACFVVVGGDHGEHCCGMGLTLQ